MAAIMSMRDVIGLLLAVRTAVPDS